MARLYLRTVCFRTAVPDLALEFRWVGIVNHPVHQPPTGLGTSPNRYTSPTHGLSLSDWGRPLLDIRTAEKLAMAVLDAAER